MKNSSRLPVPEYSYRQSLKKEDREVYRRIALIFTAFFVIFLMIWFLGPLFLSILGSAFNGNEDSKNQVVQSEEIPLQAPKLDELPETTNNDTITVSGTSSPDIKTTLLINDKEFESKNSDDRGFFKYEKVRLTDGLNLIKITVENPKKEKDETNHTITLDKIKPPLAISQPIEGANLPKETQNISVSGTTEENAIVHINGNQAVVGGSGKFSYTLAVTPGKNDITAEAVDEAGNVTIVRISVNVENSD